MLQVCLGIQQCKETCSTQSKIAQGVPSVFQWCHKVLVRDKGQMSQWIKLYLESSNIIWTEHTHELLPRNWKLLLSRWRMNFTPNVYNITDLCFLYSPGNFLRNGPLDVDGRPIPQASINGSQIGNILYSAQKLYSNMIHTWTQMPCPDAWTLASYSVQPSEEFRGDITLVRTANNS